MTVVTYLPEKNVNGTCSSLGNLFRKLVHPTLSPRSEFQIRKEFPCEIYECAFRDGSHPNYIRLTLAFCLWVALSSLPSQAQVATILGTVTDQSGAALPNVSINVTNVDTNQTSRFFTNNVGRYGAPELPIGGYTVQAQARNFQPATQQNITLGLGDRQPGASSLQQDFQVPTSAGGDANVSFNGLREGHNLWLIDGGEASDRGGAGGSDVMPSIDALAEFRALTYNYSAEYGLSSAGTLSTVVKSGTKHLHAEAWYFGRNDARRAQLFQSRAEAGGRIAISYLWFQRGWSGNASPA